MRLGTKKKRMWRRSRLADSRVFLNWTQSSIIRLQELRFDLHRFFNLFVNAWRHFWHRNSRMWHGRNHEKSRHRSCEVCLTLLNLNLGLKSSGNSKRALSWDFNHPVLWYGFREIQVSFYITPGVRGGWGNLRKFWVKMWLRGRHQDTKMLVEKWWGEAKLFKNDLEVPGPVM